MSRSTTRQILLTLCNNRYGCKETCRAGCEECGGEKIIEGGLLAERELCKEGWFEEEASLT